MRFGRHARKWGEETLMVARHVRFQVPAAKEAEFIRFVDRVYFAALREQPGFLRGSLLGKQETPGRHVTVLRFGDADQAAAWRASSGHQPLSPKLKSLHEGSEVTVLDVLLG